MFDIFKDKTPHHYDENTDEHSDEISEKGESMLHIVQISMVSLLNNILGINNYVAHKHQESKIQLQQ